MSVSADDSRKMILTNAKYIFCASLNRIDRSDSATKLPTLLESSTTLVPGPSATDISVNPDSLNAVVYGDGTQFTAAVVSGIKPIMEGGSSATPEGALRKLLLATCELLNTIMPKIGSHQRNIHGGGVVDEDFISRDLLDKKV